MRAAVEEEKPGDPVGMTQRQALHDEGADVVADSGSIRITASTAGGLVHVTLTMSPVGDAAVDEYRLFMPFEDEEVNLAMCSRLVERIGGHLLMDRIDASASLTVSLPVHP